MLFMLAVVVFFGVFSFLGARSFVSYYFCRAIRSHLAWKFAFGSFKVSRVGVLVIGFSWCVVWVYYCYLRVYSLSCEGGFVYLVRIFYLVQYGSSCLLALFLLFFHGLVSVVGSFLLVVTWCGRRLHL